MNHDAIAGFEILDILQRGAIDVYRCQNPVSGASVVLKCTQAAAADASSPKRLKHEYEVLRALQGRHSANVVKALDLLEVKGRLALVLEDIGGADLDRVVTHETLPIADIVTIAKSVAEALGDVHSTGYVHRDINPRNIVWNRHQGRVEVIDFDIAAPFTFEHPLPTNHGPGTLAFLSPEQTGRVAAPIDHRSDFYSLGATLYALLTGKGPFNTDDLMGLMHAIVATDPVPPSQLRADVPHALECIVAKMMAKAPEARYQSANGIIHDLDACLAAGQNHEILRGFVPGAADRQERLTPPRHVYGRDDERRRLLEAHDKALAGKTQLVVISGPGGAGKSWLLQELEPALRQHNGLWALGKCNQVHEDVPFGALRSAFALMVNSILMRGDDAVAEWQRHLQEAMGTSAGPMMDLVPELRHLFTGTRPTTQPPAREAEARTLGSLKRLCHAVARKNALVLLLDDMQWADAGTGKGLEALLQPSEDGDAPVLVVLCCRPEALASEGRVGRLLESLGGKHQVEHIALGPLGHNGILGVLRDAMGPQSMGGPELDALASLVVRKTGGNAFFVCEFLRHLEQRHLLEYDHRTGMWRWDMASIDTLEVADSVAEFSAATLRGFGAACRTALATAAWLGNRFAVAQVAALLGCSVAELLQSLSPAVQAGLLIRDDASSGAPDGKILRLRFSHDRIQEASLALLGTADTAKIHYKIGKLLTAAASREGQTAASLFAACDHLNACFDKLSPDEAEELAFRNLDAGRAAKRSLSYDSAQRYLNFAAKLSENIGKFKRDALLHDVGVEGVEVLFLMGRFLDADKAIDELLPTATTPLQRAALHLRRLHIHLAQNHVEECMQTGLTGLDELGIHLSLRVSVFAVARAVTTAKWQLKRYDLPHLHEQPLLRDSQVKLASELLLGISHIAALCGRQDLFAMAMAALLGLTLEHGLSEMSPIAFCGFALVVQARGGDRHGAQALVDAAQRVSERCGVRFAGSITVIRVAMGWQLSVADAIQLAVQGLHEGAVEGDLLGTYACAAIACQFSLENSLTDCAEHFARFEAVRAHGWSVQTIDTLFQLNKQVVQCLTGKTQGPQNWNDGAFDEAAFCAMVRDRGDVFHRMAFSAYHALGALLERDLVTAETWALQLTPLLLPAVRTSESTAMSFWMPAVLALTQRAAAVGRSKPRAWSFVQSGHRLLREVVTFCPESRYRGFLELLDAELAALKGDVPKAIALYQEATTQIESSGYRSMALLAHECAGRFHLKLQSMHAARYHLGRARSVAVAWGAVHKCAQLDQEFGVKSWQLEWQPRVSKSTKKNTTEKTFAGSLATQIDVDALLRASASIAGERNLERFTASLLNILLASSGGDTGVLVLVEEGIAYVTAVQRRNGACEVRRESVFGSHDVPRRAVTFSIKTGNPVILREGHTSPLWDDEYFLGNKPASFFCLPLVRQKNVLGVVCIEHHQAQMALTPAQQRLVENIAAQAVISLENARLYTDLESKVAERTMQLRQGHDKLVALGDAKNQFFANVSHELRTPLTLILAPIEILLRGGELSPRAQASLRVCQKNGLRLLRLVDDVLELSRIEGAPEGLKRHPVNLAAMVQEMVAQVRPLASRKNIAVELTMSERAQELIAVDDVQVERVLLNLLANALKFTDEDGRIDVRLQMRDDTLRVAVHDTGRGMSQQVLAHIFERFYQGDDSSTRRVGGTGIGLALCKTIVELHGGTISAQSKLGEGTTVLFELPRAAADATTGAERAPPKDDWHDALRRSPEYRLWALADAVEAAPEVTEAGDKGRPNVLVVEDNADVARLVVSLLEPTYHVTLAGDGLTGLNIARAHVPDLIVSDVMMPLMDGLALLKALRADVVTRDIPVVLLTARGEVTDRIAGQSGGANAHLKKPFSPEELVGTVRNLLRQASNWQAAGRDLRSSEMRALVASLCHEILNPLGFIRTALYVLQEELHETGRPVGDRLDEVLSAADEGVRRIFDVTSNFRVYGQSGVQNERLRVDPNDVVRNTHRLVSHKIPFTCRANATRCVLGRAGQLEQVLLNLIVNAHNASEKADISVDARDSEQGVALLVSDTGPGIAAGRLKQIFERGYTTRGDGFGLGLSISREIVREHGGDLRVESKPGTGTLFTISLPAYENPDANSRVNDGEGGDE